MNQETMHRRRWVILGVLVLSLLVVVLDNTILNVALKTIADPKKGLGASQSQLEWAINAYVLVFAGLLFTYGVMGDRYGRRRILVIGLVLFGIASALCAFAGSPGQLIAARALMGIGGAAVMPSTLSIISNVFDPAERGRAIAIWAGFTGLAIAIGPITGGALLVHFWWGSVFLINVPIVAIAVVAILTIVPESKDPNPRRFDPFGVVLSIAGLVALVYGIVRGGQRASFGSAEVWGAMLIGLLLLAAFWLIERRSDHPAFDVTLFRNPRFSAACAAISMAFFALFGTLFFLVFYLQSVRGYSPFQAGLRLLPVAVAIVFFAPRSAIMVRRFGAKAVCTAGLSIVTLAFLGYQFMGVDTPVWRLEILLFLQGTGMANVMAPATESVMSTLPRERAGAGAAVTNTLRQVGGALGVAILGSILSASYRSHATPALTALPEAVRAKAGESVEATLAAITALRGRGVALPGVDSAAKASFIHAMHVTAIGSAAAAFAGALVVLAFLPGKGAPAARGSQAPPAQKELVAENP